MKEILRIDVEIQNCFSVNTPEKQVNMISFTGNATGSYFIGSTVSTGYDTQIITREKMLLSARYMLEGTDIAGKHCRVFIENNGSDLLHCKPVIVTDSEALSDWNNKEFTATVTPVQNGVIVRVNSEN